MDIFNILGVGGSILYMVSYFMLVHEMVDGNGLAYFAMNGIAAGLVLFSLLNYWNLPAFIIELAWIMISIYGCWNIYRKREQ